MKAIFKLKNGDEIKFDVLYSITHTSNDEIILKGDRIEFEYYMDDIEEIYIGEKIK